MNWETVIGFGALYSLGGRTEVPLWVRRWFGASLAVVSFLILSWDSSLSFLLSVSSFSFLYIGLSIGYGVNDNDIWKKVFKRSLSGGLSGLTGLVLGIVSGNVLFGFLQFFLALITSVVLGVFNPTKAWLEEFLIGASYIALLPVIL